MTNNNDTTGVTRSGFIWNMIGSLAFAISSLALTYLTIRMIGDSLGGLFSIAITISQLFMFIVYYETRNYQITDMKNEFEFKDYMSVKLLNSIIMMIICGAYVLIKGYDAYKCLVVLLVCVYRLIDGVADGYESQFQVKGKLELAGKSVTYRTCLSLAAYFLCLYITGELVASMIAAIIFAVIGYVLFALIPGRQYGKMKITFEKTKKLLAACFPMFLGTFLWTYILSASRIAVDDVMDSRFQAYYQVLFMPVSVINLFAGFLFRPVLTELAALNDEKKYKEFALYVGKLLGLVAGFTAVCAAAAYLLGVQILGALVNLDLSEYKWVLTLLIIAGGFNALAVALYYVLTIFRSNISIMGGYISAAVLAFVISPVMVRSMGLMGGGLSYFAVVVFLSIVFAGCIFVSYKRGQGK